MPGPSTAYQVGIHSARPANNAGCILYSCTTHNLVYRDDGTTWTTFMTLGSGSVSDPTTTRGDMLFRNNGGSIARLPLGAANTVLHGSSTDPSYSAVLPADLDVSADNTTANATSGHHGFLPKLSGSSSDTLLGDGTWGTGGGGGSDLVQVASGAGSVRIPGIDVQDRVPASPNAKDDEFDALSGWTTLGTLDVSNVTDFASHLHLKRTSSAANVDGIYKTAPSMPFTVTAKISAANLNNGAAGHRSVGILLADSTPTALALVEFNFASGGNYNISIRKWTNRTTFSSSLNDISIFPNSMALPPIPFYIRAIVTSSTSLTNNWSLDGKLWTPAATVNPGISFANVGLSVSCPVDGSGNTVEGLFDWIRFS